MMQLLIVLPWVAAALVLTPRVAQAWGGMTGHRLIRTWAAEHLPQWQREAVGEENLKKLATEYSSLQDTYAGNRDPALAKYMEMPGGARISLHDVNPPAPSVAAMQWYLQQIGEHFRKGEKDEAMKFLGVLCHWNEDPGQPAAHSIPKQMGVNEHLWRILIPPPAEKQNLNYVFGAGGIADKAGNYVIAEESYQPRLLGASIPEAAARIYQGQRALSERAAGRIIPLIQSEIYGDGKEASKVRATAALDTARHIADVIYTALCLAAGRIDAAEAASLKEQPLTEWLSDYQGTRRTTPHPYYVVPFLLNQSMDAGRKLHPLRFSGAGDTSKVVFGFGMGTPFEMVYTLAPGGVFSHFTGRVGLHPTAGPEGKVIFVVKANDKVLFESEPLASGAPPVPVRVALPDAPVVKLTLQTIAAPGSIPAHNLVVWGEPTLIRAEQNQ